MTIRSSFRICCIPLLLAMLIAACDGNGDAADMPADTTATPPVTADTGMAVQPVPVDPISIGPDTTDGTLTITGSGKIKGTWTFQDVTALMEERAFGGKTQSILSLEAHDLSYPARHFRIRLLRDNAPITPGRYSFSSRERSLDARFEQGGEMFRAIGASGWVELRELKGDVARGRFEITLPSLADDNARETLKGTFAQTVKR